LHFANERSFCSGRRTAVAGLAVRIVVGAMAGAIAGVPPVRAAGATPFDERSVWNIAIPATAQFLPVPNIRNYPTGLSFWLDPDGVSVPVYRAAAIDPLRSIRSVADTWTPLSNGDWKTSGNSAGVEAAILARSSARFPLSYHSYASQSGQGLVLPDDVDPIVTAPDGSPPLIRGATGLKPTGNADGHLVVFQPDGKVFESYGTVVLSSGAIVCETYQITDPMLAGDGLQNGITASLMPVYAGLVTVADLESGEIDHAIKIVAPAGLLKADFTYPALSFDRSALTQTPPYSGPLPMGARLALPPSVDVGQFRLRTSLGMMIAKAAIKYGMIITDRGGAGITIIVQAGMPPEYRWTRDMDSDIHSVFGAMQRTIIPTTAYQTSRQIAANKATDRGNPK
jgi:hypothetical protein